VTQTAGVFLRIQLLRGELDPETYVTAMSGLIELIREDTRVLPVSTGLNIARLLLKERDSEEAP